MEDTLGANGGRSRGGEPWYETETEREAYDFTLHSKMIRWKGDIRTSDKFGLRTRKNTSDTQD